MAVHPSLTARAAGVAAPDPVAGRDVRGSASRYRDIRKQMPIEVNPYARQQIFSAVCLTTDVKGYTSLAEHLTRDELHDLLNEYHEMLRRLVTARRGLVWGRGGDSALCVWRTSSPFWLTRTLARWVDRQEQQEKAGRLNACLAAIEIRDAIDRFNAAHPVAKRMPTRIGLADGRNRPGSRRRRTAGRSEWASVSLLDARR